MDVSGAPPPRCQLKAPPARKEREQGRALAFVCGESMGQSPGAEYWGNVEFSHNDAGQA